MTATPAKAAQAGDLELWCLPYSPWSEKASWALDAHHVPYRKRVYQPLIGELRLRKLRGKAQGPVSVPVLSGAGQSVGDSFEIARYAEARAKQRGGGPLTLFPKGFEAQLAHYNALSETGLAAGRALAMQRMLQDPAALSEMVPRNLRSSLGKFAPKLAAFGVRRTLRKYGADRLNDEAHARALSEALEALRAGLDMSESTENPKTLLPAFSYADIAMAQVLAFVEPPKTGLRLAAGTREAFRDPVFAQRYADLIAWRDALYERYRAPAPNA